MGVRLKTKVERLTMAEVIRLMQKFEADASPEPIVRVEVADDRGGNGDFIVTITYGR